MQKNTVSIDTSVIPAKIEFAPEFNVAVSFIDRHLQEGRKDKVIIRETEGEEITYGQLAERVNQSGNVLKNLGLNSGAVDDGQGLCGVFLFVLGCNQSRYNSGSAQYAFAGQRLCFHD